MKTIALITAPLLIGLALSAGNAVADSSPVVASASLQEFIRLDVSDLTLDATNLGGPGFEGEFVSLDEAGMQIEANVPMQVSYASESGLRNNRGELSTWLQISVQGAGNTDGVSFVSPGNWTPYGALPAYRLGDTAGWTSFERFALPSTTDPDSARKGFKVRLVALRNGLNDAGGHYTTQILLTWSRM